MKKLFILGSILFSISHVYSQSPNQIKYWNYRDRLKRDFVFIDSENGGSIPISARSIGYSFLDDVDENNLHTSRTFYTDATIYLGHYLMLLATEYANYVDTENKTNTLIEIVFCLNALERLDRNAEYYLSGELVPESLNGLLLRDDVPENYHQWYTNDFSSIFDRPSLFIRSHSDYKPLSIWSTELITPGEYYDLNEQNVMSLDQLTTLLSGLLMVYEKVAANQPIQPYGLTEPIDAKNKAREIALRMIDYVITYRPEYSGLAEKVFEFKIRNWDNKLVPRGSDCTFLAPFIVEVAKKFQPDSEFEDLNFLLTAMDDLSIHVKVALIVDFRTIEPILEEFSYNQLSHDSLQLFQEYYTLEVHSELMEYDVDEVYIGNIPIFSLYDILTELNIQQVNIDLDSINTDLDIIFNEELINAINSIDYETPSGMIDDEIKGLLSLAAMHTEHNIISTFIRIIGVVAIAEQAISETPITLSSSSLNEDNVHIILELATLSGMWTPSYIRQLSVASHLEHYVLMYPIVNNGEGMFQVSTTHYIISDLLITAPCEGPYGNPRGDIDEGIWGWKSQNRLFHTENRNVGIEEAAFRGEYSGLDYMFFYNAFRLLNQVSEDYHYDVGCGDCLYEIVSDEISEIQNEELIVNRKFPDYKLKGIELYSHLGHNLALHNSNLEIRNDLSICRPNTPPTVLSVNNGSSFSLYNGNTILQKDGTWILVDNSELETVIISDELEPSADILMNFAAEFRIFNQSTWSASNSLNIHMKEGAKLWIQNSSVIDISSGELNILMEPGSEVIFEQSTLLFDSGMKINIIGEGAKLVFMGGSYNFNDAKIQLDINSEVIISDNAHVSFTQSLLNFESTTEFNLFSGEFELVNSECNFVTDNVFRQFGGQVILENSFIEFYSLNNLQPVNNYHFSGGHSVLKGEESHILFGNAFVFIENGSTWSMSHDNAVSGYIEFESTIQQELFMSLNSKFHLIGDGPDDVVLKIRDWANLWNGNYGLGEFKFEHCAIDLTNGGQIWTDLKMTCNDVKFLDEHPNVPYLLDKASVFIWNNYGNFSNTDFVHVRLKGNASKLIVNNAEFTGIRSGMDLREGSYAVSNSSFYLCMLKSQSLNLSSSITSCNFQNDICISDQSLIELRVKTSNFEGGNEAAIQKSNGKLSLRCNRIMDSHICVSISDAVLNMSSSDMAGYNVFTGENDWIVNILGNSTLNLNRGYNDFSGYTEYAFVGQLPLSCPDPTQCSTTITATNNHWGLNTSGPQYPDGTYPLLSSQDVPVHLFTYVSSQACSPLGPDQIGCDIVFVDSSPIYPANCPSGGTIVLPGKALQTISNKEPIITNRLVDVGNNKNEIESDPILTEGLFSGYTLDSALVIAAMELELIDSTGNDLNALYFFHEILVNDLDRSDPHIRNRMIWAREKMKLGLENLFFDYELLPDSNQSSFSEPVQFYVDVLNLMTDEVLLNETYKEQFYLELDKGHLFRTIGMPEVAKLIYVHLDDCQLDSTEQSILNEWRHRVEVELSLSNQYVNLQISPDSFDFEVDTSNYTVPSVMNTSDLTFGVWINGPNDLSFVQCGSNPTYRSSIQSTLDFVLYPNPTQQEFSIVGDETDLFRIELYTILGDLVDVHSVFFEAYQPVSLEIPELSSGAYLVRILGISGVQTIPLIIEK